MFDPGELAELTRNIVCKNNRRKYYRFRPSRFSNLHVRVSLKGTCEEGFSRLTGAIPEGFQLQLKSLEFLSRRGVNVHLNAIDPENFEVEELILYPSVEEN